MNVVKLFPSVDDTADEEVPDGPDAAAPEEAAAPPPGREVRRPQPAAAPSPAQILARAARRGPARRLHPGPLSPAAVIAQALDRPAPLDGFWAIWMAHQDVLRHRSFRLSGGNRADAEDALSNAMVRAAQAYMRQQVQNPRAWLLTILHNACMDQHRRNASLATIEDPAAEAPPPTSANWTGAPPSPEEELSQAQMDQAWRHAMSTLPSLLNDPLRLYLEGWSDDDIARRLNISREVVRKRRQLAKDRLRALLKL